MEVRGRGRRGGMEIRGEGECRGRMETWGRVEIRWRVEERRVVEEDKTIWKQCCASTCSKRSSSGRWCGCTCSDSQSSAALPFSMYVTEYEYLAGSAHTVGCVLCTVCTPAHTAIITLVQSHTLSLFILFSMDYT